MKDTTLKIRRIERNSDTKKQGSDNSKRISGLANEGMRTLATKREAVTHRRTLFSEWIPV